MDVSPVQRWLDYTKYLCGENNTFCEIDKENECVYYKTNEVEKWNEELYLGLTKAIKMLEANNICPSEEIEEWFAYDVRVKGNNEVDYKFKIMTKSFTFLLAIYDEDEEENLFYLSVYIKSKERLTFRSYDENDYKKEVFIYLKMLSEEIKRVFLNRTSARLKHLLNQTEVVGDLIFNDIYEKAVKKGENKENGTNQKSRKYFD